MTVLERGRGAYAKKILPAAVGESVRIAICIFAPIPVISITSKVRVKNGKSAPHVEYNPELIAVLKSEHQSKAALIEALASIKLSMITFSDRLGIDGYSTEEDALTNIRGQIYDRQINEKYVTDTKIMENMQSTKRSKYLPIKKFFRRVSLNFIVFRFFCFSLPLHFSLIKIFPFLFVLRIDDRQLKPISNLSLFGRG